MKFLRGRSVNQKWQSHMQFLRGRSVNILPGDFGFIDIFSQADTFNDKVLLVNASCTHGYNDSD